MNTHIGQSKRTFLCPKIMIGTINLDYCSLSLHFEDRACYSFYSLGGQNFCTDAVKTRFYNISETNQKQNAKIGIV